MPPTSQRRPSRRLVLVIVGALVALGVVIVLVLTLSGGNSGVPQGSGSSSLPGGGSGTGSSIGASPSTSPTVPSYTPSGSPTALEQSLLRQRVGFGGKVTGGAGGTIVHVSTDADSGTGSLRAALGGNTPRWIVFDKNMTITLSSALAVGSNKTIDGRGRKVEITGPKLDGLDIIGSSNVIVESLTMHDFGDVTKTSQNNINDAIHLDHATGVWIDHNDLSMAGDKLVAVSNGSSGITVTWNHFHDQLQVFQIGNQSTAQADTVQTVTVADNFFDHTGYRNPVVSYGRAHVYNNYYLDWKTYAVRTERAAQLYLQNNIFVAGTNVRAVVVKPGGNGCNDARTRCDTREGSLKISGNLLLGGAKIRANYVNGTVFAPSSSYPFTAKPATRSLAAAIQAGAGPQQ